MLRLKLLRKEKGVSQKEIADYINKSQQAYGKYENGQLEPDIATLKKLADYFGVSIDYLLSYTPALNSVNNQVNNQLIEKVSTVDAKIANEVQQYLDYLLTKTDSKGKYA